MKILNLSLLLLVLFNPLFVGCSKQPTSEYLGQVNGRKIYLADVEERFQEQIRQIKVQAFSTEAEKILIADAARKIGETPESYFEFFKGIEKLPLTEAEVKKYESDFGQALKLLPKAEQDKIAQTIREKRFAEAKKRLIESLKQRATIQIEVK